MSRQNYYARRRQRQDREVDADLVLQLVREERRQQPRLGGRKLLHLINDRLRSCGVKIGRDRFFRLLAANDLLIEHKPGKPKTTNSRHSLPVFHNLVGNVKPTAPNQVWVSDLTYIRTREGFVFASLTTDMFSRKIVGYFIGDTLEAEGCLNALNRALKELPTDAHPIHHSDRGTQYCCHLFVNRLQERGLPISMTEKAHCYENALAERVNGILKQEYEMDSTFSSKEAAQAAFEQSVWLYNQRRPHMSLNYRVPEEVHRHVA
jgi:transposase InsO family protein